MCVCGVCEVCVCVVCVACLAVSHFDPSHKRYDFQKKERKKERKKEIMEHKMHVLIFCTNFI